MKTRLPNIVIPLMALVAATVSADQQPSPIAWTKLSGGNGAAPAAAWSLHAMNRPGAPLLSMKLTNAKTVMIYWPSSASALDLVTCTDLTTGKWIGPAQSITDDGTNKSILVTPTPGDSYYGLKPR